MHIYIYIRLHLATKKTFFLEKKSTQNKPEGCLSNKSLNQINLIKKKKLTANQTGPKDWPNFDPTKLT